MFWLNFEILVSLFFKSETFLYIGITLYFNIYLTLQNTLIYFSDYSKHKNKPFHKKFSRKIKIFSVLKINQLHSCKQPYTLIDIKDRLSQKIFCR